MNDFASDVRLTGNDFVPNIRFTDKAEDKLLEIEDGLKRSRVRSLAKSDAMSGTKMGHKPIVKEEDIERCIGSVEITHG
jgi:hypothetical protein